MRRRSCCCVLLCFGWWWGGWVSRLCVEERVARRPNRARDRALPKRLVRRPRAMRMATLLFILCVAGLAAPAEAQIRYTVGLEHAKNQIVEVTATAGGLAPG